MRALLALPLVAAVAACGPASTVERFPDGTPYRTIGRAGGHLHGPYEVRHRDGRVAERGRHRHGLRDGVWEWTWPGGALRRREVYDEGVRDGDFVERWESGAPRAAGAWVEGDRHGVWTFHDEQGTLYAREEWDRGTRVSLERP